MKEIAGYCCAALIGISLGLIGGGGSILTMPVLVYLFGISPIIATTYSLFIVGVTTLTGAYNNYTKHHIDLKTVMSLGIPSVITILIVRKLILPHIPSHLFYVFDYDVTFSWLIMVLFSLFMIGAAFSLLSAHAQTGVQKHPAYILSLYGTALGLLTGFLGAGGGFLLIPVLVLFVGLPMKKAIGTSLLIISINSLVGFLVSIAHYTINWQLLLILTVIAIAGILTGGLIGRKIKGEKLRKGFGWFVLIMGVFILVKEIFFM